MAKTKTARGIGNRRAVTEKEGLAADKRVHMRIGVIGAGSMGGILARHLAKATRQSANHLHGAITTRIVTCN